MNHEWARELLSRERERLERELVQLRAGGDSSELSTVDQHPADLGTELFEQERDESLLESVRAELEAIRRAERRLDAGTYGFSIESGEAIPDQRLEAIPHAERTVEEQARLERQSRIARAS